MLNSSVLQKTALIWLWSVISMLSAVAIQNPCTFCHDVCLRLFDLDCIISVRKLDIIYFLYVHISFNSNVSHITTVVISLNICVAEEKQRDKKCVLYWYPTVIPYITLYSSPALLIKLFSPDNNEKDPNEVSSNSQAASTSLIRNIYVKWIFYHFFTIATLEWYKSENIFNFRSFNKLCAERWTNIQTNKWEKSLQVKQLKWKFIENQTESIEISSVVKFIDN